MDTDPSVSWNTDTLFVPPSFKYPPICPASENRCSTQPTHSKHQCALSPLLGKLLCLKKHLKKRDKPKGWKREVRVVITQLSTLPPKLDLSFLLRVKGRDGSPCIHPSPWGARQGHAIRTVKGDPAVKRSDCSSLRMSSRAFLFILPSGIQIDYVQFTSGKRSGFFFFFRLF